MMTQLSSILSAAVSCGYGIPVMIFSLILSVQFLRRKSRRYPPGPIGLPIVGNILNVPKRYPWLTYQEWSNKYSVYFPQCLLFPFLPILESDIVHLKLLTTHVFILNSAEAAKELFEKRSSVYSDRCVAIDK